jgi:hypothetical protein
MRVRANGLCLNDFKTEWRAPVALPPSSGSLIPITPTVVLPGIGGSGWNDRDVSAYVPVGATGVLLHIVDYGVTWGLRKNGSTDAVLQSIGEGMPGHYAHRWAYVGIDENRIFESWQNRPLYLVGYTNNDVTFFTNATEITPALDEVWHDVDLSALCPGAIGVIIEATGYVANTKKKGAANTEMVGYWSGNLSWFVTPCNASQVIEARAYQGGVFFNPHIYVIGYITGGVTFLNSFVKKYATSLSTWQALNWAAEAPAGSSMLLFDLPGWGGHSKFGMRYDALEADANETNEGGYGHAAPVVHCDGSRNVEVWTNDLAQGFRLIGYA